MNWSLTNYNLIVYGSSEAAIFGSLSGRAAFPADRLFGYTASALRTRYQSDLAALGELPTLVLAELGFEEQIPAVFVRIDEVEQLGGVVNFRYQHLFDQLTSDEVFGCNYFDINTSGGIDERYRTHWAVKEGNVIEGIFRLLKDRSEDDRPRLFNVEQWPMPVLSHIAVMMPFAAEFDPVYDAIKAACESIHLEARRVDEIYSPTQIMDDVFSTIAQSRLVICDLTGRNPNVLYETGLAHALNRDVIMIVQSGQDVPFDLGRIRYISYLPNNEGIERLKQDLVRSIRSVVGNN